jgi:hypothetical protein
VIITLQLTNELFIDIFHSWTGNGYRRDSDVVAPYENWQYFDPKVTQLEQDKNYALNKTKKVAWFVSNCSARNNRLQFAHELGKYIQVDIYGACGSLKCCTYLKNLSWYELFAILQFLSHQQLEHSLTSVLIFSIATTSFTWWVLINKYHSISV